MYGPGKPVALGCLLFRSSPRALFPPVPASSLTLSPCACLREHALMRAMGAAGPARGATRVRYWAGLWRVLSCGWAGLSRVFLMSSRVKLVRSDSALIDTTRLSARALPQPPLHRAVTRNGYRTSNRHADVGYSG